MTIEPMKRLLFSFALAAATATATVPALAGDLGVSVNVGEPGFYGRLDIGGAPPPELIYRRPVVIERGPVGVVRAPIYLHVRPGHERDWRRHCREYDACGQPVYFVRDRWYNGSYREYYQRQYRDHHDDRGHYDDRGHRDDRDHHDDRDHRDDHRDDHADHHDDHHDDHGDQNDHHN